MEDVEGGLREEFWYATEIIVDCCLMLFYGRGLESDEILQSDAAFKSPNATRTNKYATNGVSKHIRSILERLRDYDNRSCKSCFLARLSKAAYLGEHEDEKDRGLAEEAFAWMLQDGTIDVNGDCVRLSYLQALNNLRGVLEMAPISNDEDARIAEYVRCSLDSIERRMPDIDIYIRFDERQEQEQEQRQMQEQVQEQLLLHLRVSNAP